MKLKPATKTKCCCNCVHDIRIKDEQGMVQRNECETDGHIIDYIQCFEARCDQWEEDPWQKGENDGR